LENKWIVVKIDFWDENSPYPTGHYVRTIGDVNDRAIESEVILLEHSIPSEPFTPSVIACLPPKNWKITAENTASDRVDLRHLAVCSIDPPGCKDIDDALHARMLPNGLLEVGVHIADVSFYVRPNTALDTEAARRATTTYLCQRRLDMLPGLLTETLCSVRGNVDRFVFSVIWTLDPKTADEISVRFHRSIVHSKRAMTYGDAQTFLDDPSLKGDVADSVRLLHGVAQKLRAKRIAAGALQLASPEVRFQIDSETHDPIAVEMYGLFLLSLSLFLLSLFDSLTLIHIQVQT
jgi:exosome complex exonuclease DIS3/RRP44